MSNRNRFIDRDIFETYVARLEKEGGGKYSHRAIDEMHADLSRFVVVLMAKRTPEELRKLYTEFGWSDNMWADALHRAANEWVDENR